MPGLAESIALRLRSWPGGEVNRAAAAATPLPRTSNASAAVAELDAVAGATSVAASAGGVARAVARAAAGERTTLRLAGQDLSQASGALGEAGRRHVALVAVWSDTHEADDGGATDPPLTLTGHGIAVLAASTVQEAYDAGALARWLAEATLTPVLVVLRGTAAADTVQAWQALDPLVLANWLGRPTDEVDAETPAQAWVFGRQRARLAARWVGGHPVAVGQGFAAADRRAASDSGSEWFDNAWLALAASGSASLRALTGRDAQPLVQAVSANPSRRARPMAGHSSFPQRELLIEAVRHDYPDAVARNGKAAVQVAAPADPWLQRALRHRSDREGCAADCGSLARLWGEYVLPRAAGEGIGELDPWLAASTTPAASAELFDRSAGRAQLPAFDAARCTACGACWSACPDAALAPVALGSQAWLDAAADRAMGQGARGPGADRSRRLHKALAQRLDDELACTGAATVTADAARAAWEGAADKAKLQGDERAAAQASWNRTLAEALRLPPAVAWGLVHDAHARSRGSGLLLQLAVDPSVCQDCGICVAVCQDGALTAKPQDEIALETARAAWLCWDQTPDTTGAAIDAAKGAGLDNLAALLLSRHANRGLCGADFAAAASGQRLAVRLFAAAAEARRSVAQLRRARDLEALAAQLDEATRSVFAAAAPTGDPQALTLPPALPLWMVALGAAVAIALGKLVLGGLGHNLFNPALVGRAFLQAAFPTTMTTWSAPGQGFWHVESATVAPPMLHAAVDVVSAASPLGLVKFEQKTTELLPLVTGNVAGSLGETSAVVLVVVGVVLGLRKVFDWRLPVATLATVVVFSGVLWLFGLSPSPAFMLSSGGLLFGAVFMCTDPVTTPVTAKGAWYFGLGVGVLVVLIRNFGGLPEGVMYAILLMNAATPLLNRVSQPRRLGG